MQETLNSRPELPVEWPIQSKYRSMVPDMSVSGIPEPMNLLCQNWACLLAGSGLPQNHKRTFLVHPRTGHSKMCVSGIPETDISGTILELMYSRNVVY